MPLNTYEWTGVFLLYTEPEMNGGQQKELDIILADIRNCARTNNSKLLVIYRRIKHYKKHLYEKTYLLEVRNVPPGAGNRQTFGLLQAYKTPNLLLNGAKLETILTCCRLRFPSEKTLLFIWGHGAIFGICKKLNNARFRVEGVPAPSNVSIHNVEDMLTNEELGNAIHCAMRGVKLNVLIMINCYMQNIITQYALEKAVEYFIAPQSFMGLPGYNYAAILDAMFRQHIPACDMVRITMATLKTRWTGNPSYINNIETWSVGAFDLKKFNVMQQFIDDFSAFLLQKLTADQSLKRKIDIYVRNKLFEFDNTSANPVSNTMVDVKLLLYKLQTIDKATFGDWYARLCRVLSDMEAIPAFVGNNVYHGRLPMDNNVPCGLSVYFPFTRGSVSGHFTFPVFVSGDRPETTSLFFSGALWFQMLNSFWRFRQPLPKPQHGPF